MEVWKQILKENFNSWEVLADFLELTDAQRESILKKPRFILNIPMRLAKKIGKKTLDDPILRQFLPLIDENTLCPSFYLDPVQDVCFRKEERLLHKYNGRILIVSTSACAMHCRYCFRQNFDYGAGGDKSFQKELALIQQDSSIREIILSGGDPLSLSNHVLEALLREISLIGHVDRIRFHTRFPIGIPERIDSGFVEIIKNFPKKVWFVIHVNHSNELDEEIFYRLGLLQRLGCPILNQSVLLKGVNDSAEVLVELCETLVNQGIIPYYLHQLDRVQGAAHFETTEEKGWSLIAQLSERLPGYAVPKYVREIAGQPSKTLLYPKL